MGPYCSPQPAKVLASRNPGLFVITVSANRIFINTALLKSVETEAQALSFLAHELGHYYRSHALYLGDSYFYFYWHQKNNPDGRPVADSHAQKLVEELFEAKKQGKKKLFLKISAELNQKKLGFYTDEQEADEIGVEILNISGISPLEFITASFASWNENPSEKENCLKLYANGFLDPKKVPVFVPIGGFESHHSNCYRIFNISRENKTHKYTSKTSPTYSNAAEWTKLLSGI